jgi:opacity protein-like surface antigen
MRRRHMPGRSVLFLTLFALTLAFVAGSARDAQAQGFISPFIGYNFGGDSGCLDLQECEDKKVNWGVAFGAMGDVVGFEEEFAYSSDFFGTVPGLSSSLLTLMSNFMINPRIGAVRPYALIGVGLIKTRVEFTPLGLLETSNNNFGWDVGGGLMAFLGEHVGVRGEIRYYHSFEDLELLGFQLHGTKLDFGRVSGGVVFKF